jgi:hypothetical protein
MVAKKAEDRQQSMTTVIAELESFIGKRAATSTSGNDEATTDFTQDDNLSFLHGASPRSMATAAKKKVEKLAEATFSQQAAAAETSKQLSDDEKLLAVPRKKKTLAVAVGLGLLGVAGIIALAVIIRIRQPDGKETVVQVPDGSEIDVSVKSASGSPKGCSHTLM